MMKQKLHLFLFEHYCSLETKFLSLNGCFENPRYDESDRNLFINSSFIQIRWTISNIFTNSLKVTSGRKHTQSPEKVHEPKCMSRKLNLQTCIGATILFSIGPVILPVLILPKHFKQKVR